MKVLFIEDGVKPIYLYKNDDIYTQLNLGLHFLFHDKNLKKLNEIKIKLFDMISEINSRSIDDTKILIIKYTEFVFALEIDFHNILDWFDHSITDMSNRFLSQFLTVFITLFEIFDMSENREEVRSIFVGEICELLKDDESFKTGFPTNNKEKFIKILKALHSANIFTEDEWLLINAEGVL